MLSISIGLIDDNPAVLEQFSAYFLPDTEISLVYNAPTVADFEAQFSETTPIDILFLDIGLPQQTGLEALPRLKSLLPDTDIVMFTVQEDEDSLVKAFCNGAVGYLLKDTNVETVRNYIEIMRNGGSAISAKIAQKLFSSLHNQQLQLRLNPREFEVLKLLSEGWSYKLIADRSGLSTDGVRFYIKRIYRALNVNSKGEAIRKFYRG